MSIKKIKTLFINYNNKKMLIWKLNCFGTDSNVCNIKKTFYYQNPDDFPPGGFLTFIQALLSKSNSSLIEKVES